MSNNRLETAGRVDLKFQFGEIAQLDQEFIILEDMIPSCILGIDAIEKHDFIIDGKLKTVYRVHMDEEGEKTIANPFEICAKESEINDKRQSQFINKAKQSTLGLSESIGINGLNLKQSEGKENKLELSQDKVELRQNKANENKLELSHDKVELRHSKAKENKLELDQDKVELRQNEAKENKLELSQDNVELRRSKFKLCQCKAKENKLKLSQDKAEVTDSTAKRSKVK